MEYKFRAWDKDNEHMAYSDKHESDYDFYFYGKSGNLVCAVNCCYCDKFGDEHDDWQELDNIMPYTGVNDKYGKEIYDGDIVKFDVYKYEKLVSSIISDIKWCEELCSFSVVVNNQGVRGTLGHFLHSNKEVEVIGNIYENAELLDH